MCALCSCVLLYPGEASPGLHSSVPDGEGHGLQSYRRGFDSHRGIVIIMWKVAQRQSIRLWIWGMWVRIPSFHRPVVQTGSVAGWQQRLLTGLISRFRRVRLPLLRIGKSSLSQMLRSVEGPGSPKPETGVRPSQHLSGGIPVMAIGRLRLPLSAA